MASQMEDDPDGQTQQVAVIMTGKVYRDAGLKHSKHPNVEGMLYDKLCQIGKHRLRDDVRLMAKTIATSVRDTEFQPTVAWLDNFMRRFCLSKKKMGFHSMAMLKTKPSAQTRMNIPASLNQKGVTQEEVFSALGFSKDSPEQIDSLDAGIEKGPSASETSIGTTQNGVGEGSNGINGDATELKDSENSESKVNGDSKTNECPSTKKTVPDENDEAMETDGIADQQQNDISKESVKSTDEKESEHSKEEEESKDIKEEKKVKEEKKSKESKEEEKEEANKEQSDDDIDEIADNSSTKEDEEEEEEETDSSTSNSSDEDGDVASDSKSEKDHDDDNKQLTLEEESERKMSKQEEDETLIEYSQEEHKYYRKNIEELQRRLHNNVVRCMSCFEQVNHQLRGLVHTHPVLGIFICKRCRKYYGKGKFCKDDDGFDEYCRLCAEGGDLLCCEQKDCFNGFCKRCIKRAIGRTELRHAEKAKKWACYVCDKTPLMELRALHRLILSNLKEEDEEKSNLSRNELRQKEIKSKFALLKKNRLEKAAKATPEKPEKTNDKSPKKKASSANAEPWLRGIIDNFTDMLKLCLKNVEKIGDVWEKHDFSKEATEKTGHRIFKQLDAMEKNFNLMKADVKEELEKQGSQLSPKKSSGATSGDRMDSEDNGDDIETKEKGDKGNKSTRCKKSRKVDSAEEEEEEEEEGAKKEEGKDQKQKEKSSKNTKKSIDSDGDSDDENGDKSSKKGEGKSKRSEVDCVDDENDKKEIRKSKRSTSKSSFDKDDEATNEEEEEEGGQTDKRRSKRQTSKEDNVSNEEKDEQVKRRSKRQTSKEDNATNEEEEEEDQKDKRRSKRQVSKEDIATNKEEKEGKEKSTRSSDEEENNDVIPDDCGDIADQAISAPSSDEDTGKEKGEKDGKNNGSKNKEKENIAKKKSKTDNNDEEVESYDEDDGEKKSKSCDKEDGENGDKFDSLVKTGRFLRKASSPDRETKKSKDNTDEEKNEEKEKSKKSSRLSTRRKSGRNCSGKDNKDDEFDADSNEDETMDVDGKKKIIKNEKDDDDDDEKDDKKIKKEKSTTDKDIKKEDVKSIKKEIKKEGDKNPDTNKEDDDDESSEDKGKSPKKKQTSKDKEDKKRKRKGSNSDDGEKKVPKKRNTRIQSDSDDSLLGIGSSNDDRGNSDAENTDEEMKRRREDHKKKEKKKRATKKHSDTDEDERDEDETQKKKGSSNKKGKVDALTKKNKAALSSLLDGSDSDDNNDDDKKGKSGKSSKTVVSETPDSDEDIDSKKDKKKTKKKSTNEKAKDALLLSESDENCIEDKPKPKCKKKNYKEPKEFISAQKRNLKLKRKKLSEEEQEELREKQLNGKAILYAKRLASAVQQELKEYGSVDVTDHEELNALIEEDQVIYDGDVEEEDSDQEFSKLMRFKVNPKFVKPSPRSKKKFLYESDNEEVDEEKDEENDDVEDKKTKDKKTTRKKKEGLLDISLDEDDRNADQEEDDGDEGQSKKKKKAGGITLNEKLKKNLLQSSDEDDDDDDDDRDDEDEKEKERLTKLEEEKEKLRYEKRKEKEKKKKEEEGEENDNDEEDDEEEEKKVRKKGWMNLNITSDEEDEDFNDKDDEKEDEEEDDDNDDDDDDSDFEDESPRKRRAFQISSSESDSDAGKKRKRRKKDQSSESESEEDEDDEKPKNKRKRIKKVSSSSDEGSGEEGANKDESPSKHKKIRRVIRDEDLLETTKNATQQEEERRKRISERQKQFNKIFEIDVETDQSDLDKMVLDFDPESKKELVCVNEKLVKVLKPHQAKGIKFMFDSTIESIEMLKKKPGSGCILAHCMGLGKTLQVITYLHTLLTNKRTNKHVQRVMVACPVNTVYNWVSEFSNWLKGKMLPFEVSELISAKDLWGRAYRLDDWWKEGGVCVIGYDMFRNLSNPKCKRYKGKMKEIFQKTLVDPGPDVIVCDEGHILKNEKTALSIAINKIKTLRRIILTGTPLQNNLKEYHCMIQFVKPNLLGSKKEFMNRFVNPIEQGQCAEADQRDVKRMKRRAHILHNLLEGCVQRFDYTVLKPFLPPKFEYVISIQLSEIQVKLYQYYLDNLSQGGPKRHGSGLFVDYGALSRVWTHPKVLQLAVNRAFQQDDESEMDDFINDDSTEEESSDEKSKRKKKADKTKKKDDEDGDDIVEEVEVEKEEAGEPGPIPGLTSSGKVRVDWWKKVLMDNVGDDFEEDDYLDRLEHSGKLILLMDILRESCSIGDKVLVFSQSLLALDMMEEFLACVDAGEMDLPEPEEPLPLPFKKWKKDRDYLRLDGSTNAEIRKNMCKSFNSSNNERCRLFLISTRAGGLGINLVAANRVIIFDSSWNPSHDSQSIFRVYRFGQKKPCYIYRFVAQGTMEEKIYSRQVTKMSTALRVVDEHQIKRYFKMADLQQLYEFTPASKDERETPAVPEDRLLAELLKRQKDWIVNYHEQDSLLENQTSEELSEEERKAAWEDYENEKKGFFVQNQRTSVMPVGGMLPNQAGNSSFSLASYSFEGVVNTIKTQNPSLSQNELCESVVLATKQIQRIHLNHYQRIQGMVYNLKNPMIAPEQRKHMPFGNHPEMLPMLEQQLRLLEDNIQRENQVINHMASITPQRKDNYKSLMSAGLIRGQPSSSDVKSETTSRSASTSTASTSGSKQQKNDKNDTSGEVIELD